MHKRVRILGIDPGSRLSGFGVLDFTSDSATYVASGSVNSIEGEFAQRLKMIFHSIIKLIEEYQPDVFAIESVFVHRNPGSALKLGHARSAAICATFDYDIEVFEYAPREVKQAIVGTGAATKEQVQHMVMAMLKLEGPPSPDAADALAIALCHGHQRRMSAKLADEAMIAGLR